VSLDRFVAAQNRRQIGYADALAEIRAGAKQGHWIWYVFPQLYGLGTSDQSRAYGIRGVAEATEYLTHEALRPRLIEMTGAVADQVRQGRSLQTVMGSPVDVLKLVSSLTLFGGIARRLACEDPSGELERLAVTIDGILTAAQGEGFPPCERTLKELG
jgi:uncharacterized protein (DUF1810 family)